MRRRGLSLQIVILVVACMIGVVAAMASLFTMNMNLSQAFANGQTARAEAEAGVAQATADLALDETFGTRHEEIRDTATPGMSSDRAWHLVTFRTDRKAPFSTNNNGTKDATGYLGRRVPPAHVLIFSTGYCLGQYCTVEALLEEPPYPYAIAASGPLQSLGPVWVEGTDKASDYVAGKNPLPGDIASNSIQGIQIGTGSPGTTITGFARSAGPIAIAPPAVVREGIRPRSGSVALPDLDPNAFNTQNQSGVFTLNSQTKGPLDTFYYAGHDVTMNDTVQLQNGMVFVNGSVTLQNGVTGTGAIVATGGVTLSGGASQLDGASNIALVAGGPITVAGGGRDANFFQGLIYSHDSVSARDITVVGNVVVDAAANAPGQGVVALDNVHLVSNREASSLTLSVGGGGTPGLTVPAPQWTLSGGTPNGGPHAGAYNGSGGGITPNSSPLPGGSAPGPSPVPMTLGAPDQISQETPGHPAAGQMPLASALQIEGPANVTIHEGQLLAQFPSDGGSQDAVKSALSDFEAAQKTATGPTDPAWLRACDNFANTLAKIYNGEPDTSGSAGSGTQIISFELNKFLPTTSRLRVQCWKLYSRQL